MVTGGGAGTAAPANNVATVSVASSPTQNKIVFAVIDGNSDIWPFLWNGTNLSKASVAALSTIRLRMVSP